jgi:hypothetical protein
MLSGFVWVQGKRKPTFAAWALELRLCDWEENRQSKGQRGSGGQQGVALSGDFISYRLEVWAGVGQGFGVNNLGLRRAATQPLTRNSDRINAAVVEVGVKLRISATFVQNLSLH